MQRTDGQRGRGFTVSHQKVALELAFSTKTVAQGYTELVIQPTDRNLRTIHLNSRQCRIQSVTCAGQSAEFSVVDHLSSATLSNPKDVHLYPELKRKIYAASSDGSGGELSILIPFDIVQETSEEATADFSPFSIRIYYALVDPSEALQVVLPTQEAPYRVPHLYTTPSCPDFSRYWVPCVDSLWERCTWELELVVPREIEGEDVVVVCSGELVEQIVHPHNPGKIIFYYSQAMTTSVQHIAFAAGPFTLYDIPLNKNHEDRHGQVLSFCLPGREEEMYASVGVIHQALDFFSREFGSYPFGSFKVAFIDDPVLDVYNASTLALCSSDLLYPTSVIDQAFETRHILSHCVAFQWIGINIIQKTWSDTWLIHGLSLYITGLFLRRLLGNNEYRFRLKKDCDRLCNWDISMPPLYISGKQDAPEDGHLAFINLKAPLVLHILDRRLCKAGASLGLGRVIPKVFLQAITGEMIGASLSTGSFLRTCRRVSGIELKKFADQWIFGSGCPRFYCNANFNKKKLIIEFNITQISPAYQFAQARPLEVAGCNPVQVFEGQMTVRIHEADGTPYEHVFDLNAPNKRFEVPFNTKYKRVRRNTKRFKSRQAAAQAAAEGDEGAAEDISLMDLGFGLGLWEEEEQREKWKVADWTEEDEAQMSSAPYEWIRLDADFEWIAEIVFDQRDYMWVSQLQRDRDVVAQVAAIQALASMPNAISSSMLARTALVSKYFFRIRIEAIHNLVGCALASLDYLGLFHLLMLFRTTFCHEVPREDRERYGELEVPCIPKANEFSNYADYFIRRALIQAISRVRNDRGRTLPQVKTFLINLLRYNDNSTNKFVDDFYLAGLISCLSNSFVPRDSRWGQYVPANEDPDALDDTSLLQVARQEVERFQELDKLVPSYHNVVTMSCLDFQACMMLVNLIPVDLAMLHAYTRQGNFVPIRIVALDYLLLLKGLEHKVLTRYYFALLRSDESRTVKRALARSMCESFAISIVLAENRESAGKVDENGEYTTNLIEDMLKVVRREVGRSMSIREAFLDALLHARIDQGERWALIKLGELLFKPSEEREVPFQTKMSLRVRMPTVNETFANTIEPADPATPSTKIKLIRSDTTPRVAFDESAAKKKKHKTVAPGQASGMSLSDLTACRNCLKKMEDSKHSHLFRKPVDPVRDRAADYFNLISTPMDLSSISNKLNEGLYKDRFEFRDDFNLLISNAKTYTPDEKAYVHIEAVLLEKEFNMLWNRITKTLEQAAARTAHVAMTSNEEEVTEQPRIVEDSDDPEVEAAAAAAAVVVVQQEPMAPPPVPPTKSLGGIKIKFKAKPVTSAPISSSPQSVNPPIVNRSSQAPQAKQNPPILAERKAVASSHSPSPAPSPRQGSSPAPTRKPSQQLNGGAGAASDVMPIHPKRCRAILQLLKRQPEAYIFLQPVNPIADGVPTYLHEIKHPMDLGTMEQKLNSGSYRTMSQFHDDAVLIFDNCRQFNPVGTIPVTYADSLERVFFEEWKTAIVPKLEYVEIRSLQSLLNKLKLVPESYLFLQAVDPIALGIPHYFDVVRKQDARDLSLLEVKLKRGDYVSFRTFDADVRLMLDNCYRFNAGDEAIVEVAKAFERSYEKYWNEIKSKFAGANFHSNGKAATKRKAETNGSASASRKKKH
ncbi:hypothetical protein CBS101457_004805 [Exobasidium rhododendri]|nr:hypothetical protein CBS101457_004805 [Exobasidium rhododendri]